MDFDTYCSIMTACVSDSGDVFISVMNDQLAEQREQHSVPLVLESECWTFLNGDALLPWLAAGATRLGNEVFLVGWGGQALAVNGIESRREGLVRRDAKPVSVIRSVATIGNEIYAVGLRRQVFMRSANTWTEFDLGVLYDGDAPDIGFEAIAGFDSDEMYAVGFGGAIWCCEKRKWSEIHSPTNLHLHSICCAADGKVYVGGRNGILLIGRGQNWEVQLSGLDDTIWDIHWFEGRLFILTVSGVFVDWGNGLEAAVPEELLDDEYVELASSASALFIFGYKSILKFEGRNWQKLPMKLREGQQSSPAFALLNGDATLDEDDEDDGLDA